MRDIDLYAQILGLRTPWKVVGVELDRVKEQVVVKVAASDTAAFSCPHCGQPASRYDKRLRRWRHLDTCQFVTILEAQVPRLSCPEHGVINAQVPWADSGSGFTLLFEALVIDWLKEASIQAVSRQLKVSWNSIDRIMARAVARGLARRQPLSPTQLCVDETSFRRKREYVTVVTDPDNGQVLHVSDGNRTESLTAFYTQLSSDQLSAITGVSMDMWPAFITATQHYIPDAKHKIAFDKFHVVKLLSEALDRVRYMENRELLKAGSKELKNTKYVWLKRSENMTEKQLATFESLRDSSLRTAKAWAIKDLAMQLWSGKDREEVERQWTQWLEWALKSGLPPICNVAKTIKRRLWGIVNAIVLNLHNGHAESMNARIQRLKQRACGFRSRERFRNAIFFHFGGLDLYPRSL